MNIETGHFL